MSPRQQTKLLTPCTETRELLQVLLRTRRRKRLDDSFDVLRDVVHAVYIRSVN